jgi:hypothetical protein
MSDKCQKQTWDVRCGQRLVITGGNVAEFFPVGATACANVFAETQIISVPRRTLV